MGESSPTMASKRQIRKSAATAQSSTMVSSSLVHKEPDLVLFGAVDPGIRGRFQEVYDMEMICRYLSLPLSSCLNVRISVQKSLKADICFDHGIGRKSHEISGSYMIWRQI